MSALRQRWEAVCGRCLERSWCGIRLVVVLKQTYLRVSSGMQQGQLTARQTKMERRRPVLANGLHLPRACLEGGTTARPGSHRHGVQKKKCGTCETYADSSTQPPYRISRKPRSSPICHPSSRHAARSRSWRRMVPEEFPPFSRNLMLPSTVPTSRQRRRPANQSFTG